jgi:DNA mismatch endonuclease (patch repair protein)
LPKYRTVIFVHGCFWHRHARCRKATTPTNNAEFWRRKFDRNRLRDRRNLRELKKLGWKCVTIWQCDTTDGGKLAAILQSAIQFSTSLKEGK